MLHQKRCKARAISAGTGAVEIVIAADEGEQGLATIRSEKAVDVTGWLGGLNFSRARASSQSAGIQPPEGLDAVR